MSELPSFDNPQVQQVYELLCAHDDPPPSGEHWEGWLARKIVMALRASAVSEPPCEERESLTIDKEHGTRLVGPHGGLKESMPNPTDADLSDPLFEAIWQVTKRWDVNAPEYYVGYCGMNGSHVMLILNAIRESRPVEWPEVPSEAMIDAAFAATVWPDMTGATSSDIIAALRENMRKEYKAMRAAYVAEKEKSNG